MESSEPKTTFDITIIEAADEFKQLAQYEFDEQIMASLVPIGDDMIIRKKKAVYRFAQSDRPVDQITLETFRVKE